MGQKIFLGGGGVTLGYTLATLAVDGGQTWSPMTRLGTRQRRRGGRQRPHLATQRGAPSSPPLEGPERIKAASSPPTGSISDQSESESHVSARGTQRVKHDRLRGAQRFGSRRPKREAIRCTHGIDVASTHHTYQAEYP